MRYFGRASYVSGCKDHALKWAGSAVEHPAPPKARAIEAEAVLNGRYNLLSICASFMYDKGRYHSLIWQV